VTTALGVARSARHRLGDERGADPSAATRPPDSHGVDVNSVRLGPRRDQRADDRVRSFKPGDECVARVDRGVDGLGVGLQHGGVEHAENIEAVVG